MTRQTQIWLFVAGLSVVGLSLIGLSAMGWFAIGLAVLGLAVLGLAAAGRWWHANRQQRSRVVSVALVVVLAVAYTLAVPLGEAAPISHAATDFRPMPTHSFSLASTARILPAHWSKTVSRPSAAEAKAERDGLAKIQSLQAPTLSLSHQKPVSPASLNPPLAAPARQRASLTATTLGVPTSPLADSDFNFEQGNTSNGNGTGPAYPCTLGWCTSWAEPSVAGFGAHLMESYNYYDALSSDGGATWSYLNPANQFTGLTGVGWFCCDQQVLYEPSRSTLWWEQHYGANANGPAGLGIATASGTNLSSWCFYYLTAASLGYPSTDGFDSPDIAYTNDYLFLSFNLYTSASVWVASGVARMPLTALSSCGTFSSAFFTTTANFNFALAQGAQGTMWFVSDAYVSGSATGSSLNICQWQDPASSPGCVDRTIPAFTYLTRGNCASQDGVVTNWCSNLDSRARSAFFTKANFRGFGPATLGVALSVGPAGSQPFPWVAIYYFEVAGLPYVAEDALYGNRVAIAYPSFAPNFRGWLGFSVAYGGGTGTGSGAIDYYPTTLVGLFDPASATPPFESAFQFSRSNASTWGDYNTIRPLYPSALPFISGIWLLDSAGNIFVGEWVIDRLRDHGAYLQWHLS